MADTQTYYDSPLTGEELDEALRKIPQIDTAVQQASDSAVLSQSWTQGGTGDRAEWPVGHYRQHRHHLDLGQRHERVGGFRGANGLVQLLHQGAG